jgi:hypothetical protein
MKIEWDSINSQQVSCNNHLILSPYKKTKEIKQTEVATGFVMAQAKVSIEPLELLADAIVLNSVETLVIPKGSLIYFKEETLMTQQWSRKVYNSEVFSEGFILGNFNDVVFMEIK